MKKQSFITILITILLSMVDTRVLAFDNIAVKNADGVTIYYFINGTEVSVTQGSYSGSVVIPEEITYMNRTKKVTGISEEAFYGCSNLTSVTIPGSVKSIGPIAFKLCNNLTSVTIGNGVTSIGEGAFKWCSSLTSIVIPSSVTSVGSDAFTGTGWYDNQSDGLLYLNKWLIGYKGTKPVDKLIIAEGTTGIAAASFTDCTSLTSVTIPNSVTNIGNAAFSGCSGLTSVTIGNSVKSIGGNAFYGCSSLTSITIPNSVTSIGNSAFSSCSGLTSVTISDNITSIGSNVFTNTGWYNNQSEGLLYLNNLLIGYKGTKPVDKLIIAEGTTGIAAAAFSYCSGLISVTIPNSVTNIGSYAFQGCRGLTSITIPSSVTSIDSYAFDIGCPI